MPSCSELPTFGCICYLYLRPYEDHKLAFRSKQCIFIGYSNQQKRYCCLEYSTDIVFISRHVVFDEVTFPNLDIYQSSNNHTSNQFFDMSSLPLSFPLPSNVQNLNTLPNASYSDLIHQTTVLPDSLILPTLATPNSTSLTIKLNSYYDSDWVGNSDDRCSTTGYGVFLGNNLISWSSKKQRVVSRSNTKAEYRSMAHTTAELYWLHMIFSDLKIILPTALSLWCDNINAIVLASNLVFHAHTNHIEIDYHFIKEKGVNRDIQVKHILTQHQIAYIFTQSHIATRFTFLRSKLSMCFLPNSLRGVL